MHPCATPHARLRFQLPACAGSSWLCLRRPPATQHSNGRGRNQRIHPPPLPFQRTTHAAVRRRRGSVAKEGYPTRWKQARVRCGRALSLSAAARAIRPLPPLVHLPRRRRAIGSRMEPLTCVLSIALCCISARALQATLGGHARAVARHVETVLSWRLDVTRASWTPKAADDHVHNGSTRAGPSPLPA